MNDRSYVCDVYVIVEMGKDGIVESPNNIVHCYANEEVADEVARGFNERYRRLGLPNRYYVVCRELYE